MTIEQKIESTKAELRGMFLNVKDYLSLSETERFPYRAMRAEILAYEDYLNGVSLDFILKICIENESYAGCEGILRASKFIKQLA